MKVSAGGRRSSRLIREVVRVEYNIESASERENTG
jgi:hypothetical protein